MIFGIRFKSAAAWLLAGGAWLLPALSGVAQSVDASIQSISAPGGTEAAPFYVIDSDADSGGAGYDRDTFGSSVQVNFSLASGYTSGSGSFRVAVQLIDDQGNAMELSGTTSKTVYSASQSISLDGATPASMAIFNVTIDPDEDLGAGKNYHLEARVQKWSRETFNGHPFYVWATVDGPDDSSSFVTVHFTGPNASDWAKNVRGYTTGAASWARSYAVATDPDKNEFIASVPYRLMRYDVGEGLGASSVGIQLDVDLFDETGAEVPLVNDGKSSTSLSMVPYYLALFGNPVTPSAYTGGFLAAFRPTANLDSRNHSYRATVNVRHVEIFTIPTSTLLDDGTEETSLRRLLHFNGTLLWGSLATTMRSISNDPVVGGFGSGYLATQVRVDGGNSEISTRPDLQFGTNQLLNVRLYSDGHAEVTSGTETVTTSPGGDPVGAEFGHVKVIYPQTRLSASGPYATGVDVRLPQGLGYTADVATAGNRFEQRILFAGTIGLDPQFRHSGKRFFSPSGSAAVFDEARPLVYKVGYVEFDTTGELIFKATGSGGIEYCHGRAFEQLETDEADGYHEKKSMVRRMTNDGYLRHVDFQNAEDLIYTAVQDGSARLDNAPMVVEPGHFTAHFPMGTLIEWTGQGALGFKGGGINPGSGLTGVQKIGVPFDGSCSNDQCASGGKAEVEALLTPEGGKLDFSRDGSLHGGGVVEKISLQWGLRSDGSGGFVYSHRTGEFNEGIFDMAGQFAYADELPTMSGASPWAAVAADLAPASVLFAGCDPGNPEHLVYPGTQDYIDGDGFYAGHNFVAKSSLDGASRIGGATQDYAYTLMDDASKYYVRRGGLSGRHAPEDGSYDGKMGVYGYDFQVTLFQLTFLSNRNVLSWFNGAVDVPYPSDFDQAFKGLTLTCTGDLDHAEIDPEDLGPKPLRYWNGEFTPLAVLFSEIAGSGTSCYPERALVIGLTTEVAHIPGNLSGNLAFMNTGNIAVPADGVEGAEGRLGIPASIRLEGPGEENWVINPCSKLYFNNPDYDPDSDDGTGFVTFAGTMNAPWFEDLEVHLLTSASSGGIANVYLTGGWSDSGGETYFTDTNFDDKNKGYPQGDVDLDTYKNLPVGSDYYHGHDAYADYRVTARQSLFGLVDLSYSQEWSVTGRYFKSAYPVTDDLVVIKDLFHQVDYMSPERLDVSFGAKYEGLPRINLAGAAFEAVDEQLGAAKAIADAAGDQVTAALNEGIEEIDALIADALEDLIDELLQELGLDVLDPLYQEMMTTYAQARANGESFNDWLSTLDDTFNKYFDGTVGNYSQSLRGQLDKLSSAADEAMSMINRAKSAVDKGVGAIDAITREIDGHPGLLKEVGGQRQIVQTLAKELIKQLAGDEIASALSGVIDEAGSEFNQKLNELLEDMDPTFDQLVDVLEDLRGYLVEVQGALDTGGELVQSFQDIVTQAGTELDALVSEVRSTANKYINDIATSAQMVVTDSLDTYGSLFDEFSDDTFRSLLTAEIRDLLLQSGVYQQFQYVLRQWVGDLNMAMHNAIDSVFAEVQNLVKDVIDEALGPIDDAINEALGDIDKYLGAGSILGSAQFNGDSLKRLRLDGEFQFKIPDDMELHAYLEILQYTSGDDFAGSGCLEPGEKALEVKLGATDVAVDWLSPDMRADMEVKFSMQTAPSLEPRGVGGSFEMTGGSLNFEAFKITEFAAGVGVGADECYVAASARMIFSSYELAGGLFFGRTCTIEPLEMIDKDVAELLGDAPFTGAYVYGEVWLPISELVLGIPASCMFNISAGVGAGAFYFVEGPTWGGQMLLGISGEALCVVSIKGTVKMIGVMNGNSLRFSGRGSLTGKAGACPFCIKFSKSAKMGYQDGDWSVDL